MVAATSRVLRLGTRASPLAMAQAHMVKAALLAAHGWEDAQVEIRPQVADGDKVLDRPLAKIGGKALWTKGLDRALLGGEIDLAVHSMKDVETIRPDAIVIAAMLERADVRDRLIGAEAVAALKTGARVGTSSPRRAAQLRRLRPDLDIVMFRGNVATRLAKLEGGEADATLLAAAGLDRLGQGALGVPVSIDEMLPAASQGAIGIECRADDGQLVAWLAAIDHAPTHRAVRAERAFLAALSADCHSPVGAHARAVDGGLLLTGEILSGDGALQARGAAIVADDADAAALAARLLAAAPPALRALFSP